MTRPIAQSLAFLLVISGCTTWQSVRAPAPGAPSTSLEGEVRVTRSNGGSYMLRDVRIANDSVIGMNAAGARVAIANSDVSTIETRRVSTTRSVGLIGATTVGILAIATIAAAILLAGAF